RVVKNGSKIWARSSAGMPGPSSASSRITASPMYPARADSRDDAHDDSRDPVRQRRRLAGWAALGGGLFVFSDAMLATNKFMAPLPAATLWVLPAYWAAQWLIASSLNPRR
ncbi:MAG: hypothetical protein HUU30_19915, partial [Burkholderiaceae bacterium]|nr:hypothetical protein [Burkholderiaceae bacterium]